MGDAANVTLLAERLARAHSTLGDSETANRYNQHALMLAEASGAPPVTRRVPFRSAFAAAFLFEVKGRLTRSPNPPWVTRYAPRRVALLVDRSKCAARDANRTAQMIGTHPVKRRILTEGR